MTLMVSMMSSQRKHLLSKAMILAETRDHNLCSRLKKELSAVISSKHNI